MQYIINSKMLSIPPFISTSWDNVCSLHVEQEDKHQNLVIALKNSTTLRIPGLDSDILTKIFQTHTQYLDASSKKETPSINQAPNNAFNFDNMVGLGFPMKFGPGLEGLGAAMQHNPEQSNSPDLPADVIEKISAISKIMDTGPNLIMGLKAEPHCNCMHCQIARAVQGKQIEDAAQNEEIVSDEDLKFRSWDISQSGEKLYVVTNPLNSKEKYNVFLGDPLGCTCGQKNCDHIKAVLNT